MEEILIGSTDRTILVFIPDPASTDGSGKTGLVAADLTVSYTRAETDNDVAVTDVTSSLNDLAALTTAHTDWGLKEVSNTLAPGLYRLDIADAVFATGAWYAVVYVMITTSAAAATPKAFKLTVSDVDAVKTAVDLISIATNSGDLASKTADAGDIVSSTGSTISGTFSDTASDDNTYWITAPVTPAVAGFGLRQNLRFDLVLGRVPTQLEIKGYWNGGGQTAEIYALNARTGVYDKLTNAGTNLLSRSSEFTYPITIPRDYADDSGGVNNIVTIEIRSTSTNTAHRMRIDRALVYHVDEAAIFTITTPTAEQIWTYINRTLTTPGEEPSSAPTAAENAAELLATAYEGSTTFQDFLRLAAAVLYGPATDLDAAAPAFRDEADTKDRVAATGLPSNRVISTLDPS